MVSDRICFRVSALLVGVVALGIVNPATAQYADESFSRLAFQAADQNGDDIVDEAEMASDTAAAFASRDANSDGLLEPGEISDMSPDVFNELDTDGDGKLTFNEIMREKIKLFYEEDPNRDGEWTLEEVIAYDNAVCQALKEGGDGYTGPYVGTGPDIRCKE